MNCNRKAGAFASLGQKFRSSPPGPATESIPFFRQALQVVRQRNWVSFFVLAIYKPFRTKGKGLEVGP
jgi:hypothetical protein